MASHQAGVIEAGQSVEWAWPGCHKGTPASILHLLPQRDGWPYRHTIRNKETSPHEDWTTSYTST